MKLTKRLVALVIVICTLGAMMIPGVSVSAEGEGLAINFANDLTTVFTNNNLTALNSGTAAYVPEAVQAIEDSYPSTIQWKFYKDSTGSVVFTGRSCARNATNGLQMRTSAADVYSYYPLVFQTPATGVYTMSLKFTHFSGLTEVGGYIVEVEDGGYTVETLPKHDDSRAQALISQTAKGTFDSSTTVTIDASKSYVLVLYCVGTKAAAYSIVNSFTLNYQGPVEPEEPELPPRPESDTLVVNFATDLSEKLGYTTANSIALNGNFSKIQAAYEAQTIDWMIHQMNAYAVYSRDYGNYFRFENVRNDNYGYVALQFTAPKTGKFTLALDINTETVDASGAYIIPVPAQPYTKDTLKTVVEELLNEEALLPFDGRGLKIATEVVDLTYNQEYLLVLYGATEEAAASGKYVQLNGFSLTRQDPVASIGEASYYTLSQAIEAANAMEGNVEITVIQDAVTGAFNLSDHVVLDLNGYTVNTQNNAVEGTIVDSSDGGGFLYAPYSSELTNRNGEITLWDTLKNNAAGVNGWRIYHYTYKSKDYDDISVQDIIACKFWATLKFENPEALKRIETNGQISLVGFSVQWTPAEGEPGETFKYGFVNTEMSEWAADEQTAPEGKTYGFYIDIKGFQKIQENGTLTVTPYIQTPKATFYANAATYTHTVTQS